jgi:hypothetical protein
MEPQQYTALFNYLTTQEYPAGYNIKKKNQLKKAATYFEIHNNLLWHKSEQDAEQLQRVIKISELEAVLYNSHDNPLSGHLKFEATYNRIAAKYYWYGMRRTIQNYVTNCETCQRDGSRRKNEPLRTIKVGQPFERIGIDIVGPLPKTSQGHVHIVVAVDYLTKWPEARAIPDATAESVAKFFYEDIICRHGCPKEIVSDNSSAFISQLVEKLLQQHQIKHRLISPYHPQTNGLVERFNRTLCKAIAKYVQLVEEEWDKFIPSVLFAYRTMKHNTTKYEPFKLVYGRNALTPLDLLLEPSVEDQDEATLERSIVHRICQVIDVLEPSLGLAQKNIEKSQQEQERRHRTSSTAQQFQVGDLVLKYKHAKEKESKFLFKWVGPYSVHEVFGNGAYRLRTMDGKILKSTTNGNDLKKYHTRELPEPEVVIE